MHNKLSFLNSFTVVFFAGKVAHFGALAGLAWPLVFIPLLLDLIFDILLFLGYIDRALAKIRVKDNARRVRRIIEQEKHQA